MGIPGAQVVTLPSGRVYQLTGVTGGLAPRPAVLGLTFSAHSGTWLNDAAWSTGVAATSGWHRHAAAHGYTLILPEPVSGAWNVGTGTDDPNPTGWPGSGQDDEQFLLDVVADARARTPIDAAQVMVAGGSAGGGMAARMAVDHPDVFAACALVAGWFSYRYPTRPLDCRIDHGTADTTVPIRGGAGADGYRFPAAYEAMSRAPRGSRVALYATAGGHDIPGWWASAVWAFFTVERARP